MKTLEEIRKSKKVMTVNSSADGGSGYLAIGRRTVDWPFAIWSNGGGWDHVSVSHENRCPTWEEMCEVKEIFFRDDECCIEYHPPKSEYVNVHPYCLHIWRPQGEGIPMPPKVFV